MLGKLLKYEIKSTARFFLPLYASLIIFAIINNIFIKINTTNNRLFLSIISGISIFAYVFIIIAIFTFAFFVMILRFYKNLLGDEGYLMFTLPVTSGQHIFTKLITSMMWIIASFIVTLISIILISFEKDAPVILFLQELFGTGFVQINSTFGAINVFMFIVEFTALFLAGLAAAILMIYASLAIGQMISRHKILGAFGAYLALNIVTQIIASILIISFSSFVPEYWNSIDHLINSMAMKSLVFHLVFIGVIFTVVVFAAAYYFITRFILSRKLNLE